MVSTVSKWSTQAGAITRSKPRGATLTQTHTHKDLVSFISNTLFLTIISPNLCGCVSGLVQRHSQTITFGERNVGIRKFADTCRNARSAYSVQLFARTVCVEPLRCAVWFNCGSGKRYAERLYASTASSRMHISATCARSHSTRTRAMLSVTSGLLLLN